MNNEIFSSSDSSRVQKSAANLGAQRTLMEQIESEVTMEEWSQSGRFGAYAIFRRFPFQSLNDRVRRREREKEGVSSLKEEQAGVEEITEIEAIAKHYQEQNNELQYRSLLALRNFFTNKANVSEILKKILDFYPDQYLASDALEFLIETTSKDTNLKTTLLQAKEQFSKKYEREIKVGRNIRNEIKRFTKEGLGTPPSLRDLYRDITGNPRPPLTLFDELITLFSYDQMEKVIKFLLRALGSDLKSKGPSISSAELKRLITETRSLQSILWIYKFFFYRMIVIHKKFHKHKLSLPKHINFILLSKALVLLLQERYLSQEKIFFMTNTLDIGEDLMAHIILLTQYRDAMRQISPKLFRSENHRQEVLSSILQALTTLEDRKLEEDQTRKKH